MRNIRPIPLAVWLFFFAFSLLKMYGWHAESLDVLLLCHSDPEGYYQYLPTLVNDVPFSKMKYAHILENGNHLSMFTLGVAVLQLPFFLLGVGVVDFLGITSNYYDAPFAIANGIGVAFYLATALLLIYRVLSERISVKAALVVITVLYFGTNLYYYSTREPFSSHIYSFFLISYLVYLAHAVARNGWNAARVSWWVLLSGILALIRLPNVIFALVPFFVFALSGSEVLDRFRKMIRHRPAIILGLIPAALAWVLQSAYWHLITGKFYIVTYSYKGEGFNWLQPELWNVLFSHQNGLFIYAPLLIIPVVFTIRKSVQKELTHLFILGAFIAVWYLYASWWCWWLGGAYGHRGFIDMMPLLAIPAAHCVEVVRKRGKWISRAALLPVVFLCLLQYEMSAIYWWPWEGENWTWQTLWEKTQEAFTNILL